MPEPRALRPEPAAGGARREPVGAAVALACALAWPALTVLGVHGAIVGLALAACGALALRSGRGEAAALAFLTATAAALVAAPPLVRLWPAPLALALAGSLILHRLRRVRAAWLAGGEWRGPVAAWIVLAAAASAGALVAWWAAVRPDPEPLVLLVAGRDPAVLAAGIAGWAMLNAASEELYFRGALQHELVRHLGGAGVAAQALAFGLLHRQGFPGGWSGVVLASIYGLMMGALRLRAGGLLAPWLAHVAADLVIAAIGAQALRTT